MDNFLLFPILALIVAGFDWLFLYSGRRKLGYLSKPGVMVILLIWIAVSLSVVEQPQPILWFGLAVVFSLVGDILLMLPQELFLGGLVAFLLGHLAYVVGLNPFPLSLDLPTLILAVVIFLIAGVVFRSIDRGVVASGRSSLRIPVIGYALVITLMVVSAVLTVAGQTWDLVAALMVSLGAVLFFVSDTLLAWNRFVHPIHLGRLKNRIPYHLGQILLVAGAIANFLP